MIKMFFILLRKPIPSYAHYGFWFLVWKLIRKILNVVIIPNIPLNFLRVRLYRLIGYRIGRNVFIGMKCYIDDMEPTLINIEDNVTISYCVKFAIHGINQNHTPIIIKKGAYIGMNVTLISGKKGLIIEEDVIIGAGSVVTRSIPSSKLAVGNPARISDLVHNHSDKLKLL